VNSIDFHKNSCSAEMGFPCISLERFNHAHGEHSRGLHYSIPTCIGQPVQQLSCRAKKVIKIGSAYSRYYGIVTE
jgi:hypothetical protein